MPNVQVAAGPGVGPGKHRKSQQANQNGPQTDSNAEVVQKVALTALT